MRELTMHEVAAMFGKSLDSIGKRSFCPIRVHKRADKSFSLFRTSDGKVLFKCFSCSEPDNVGDAIKLYSLLSGVDRKEAWHSLREMGYDVPGAKGGPERPSRPPLRKAVSTVEGRLPDPKMIIPLNVERWDEVRLQRMGAVEKFARSRSLDANVLRQLDVVDMGYDAVGFGYRDPSSGRPCRIKVRALDRKAFWIEPRANKGESGVALSPLYLADKLDAPDGLQGIVIVTEGEVDALSLRCVGIRNVVSLPDGSGSAGKVDLKPIWYRAALILSAVDADAEGDKANQELFSRSMAMGKQIARVRWQLGDGEVFKDANDALKAGWTKEMFVSCLQRAANELRGYEVNLASAC